MSSDYSDPEVALLSLVSSLNECTLHQFLDAFLDASDRLDSYPVCLDVLRRLRRSCIDDILDYGRIADGIRKIAEDLDLLKGHEELTDVFRMLMDKVSERDNIESCQPNIVLDIVSRVIEHEKSSDRISLLLYMYEQLVVHGGSRFDSDHTFPWQYYTVLGMQRLLKNMHVNMCVLSAWSDPNNNRRVKFIRDVSLSIMHYAAQDDCEVFLVDNWGTPIGDIDISPFTSLWSRSRAFLADPQSDVALVSSLEPVMINELSILQLVTAPRLGKLIFHTLSCWSEPLLEHYTLDNRERKTYPDWDRLIRPYVDSHLDSFKSVTTMNARLMNLVNSLPMKGPSPQVITVRRKFVFDDIFNQRGLINTSFTPVVQFSGGAENSNALSEWYMLLGHEMVASERKLFKRVEGERYVVRDGPTDEATAEHMHFAGTILARAFIDGKTLGVTFADSVYSAIVGEDSGEDMPDEERGDMLTPLIYGFHSLVPSEAFGDLLTFRELKKIMTTDREYDVEDLIYYMEFDGYTSKSPQITWFADLIRSYSKEDLAKFINFITGSPEIPTRGFCTLWSPELGETSIVVTRVPRRATAEQLPVCINRLLSVHMPEYKDFDDLNRNLRVAIEVANRRPKSL